MQHTTSYHPITALKEHLQHTIVGQSRLVDRLLITVLTEGHLLVEGVPGLAKTTAVRTLAAGMALRFQRIQFTPDMIPGDITGTDIFVPADGHFRFIEGPLFHEIILADEINRAPPKVQSALLEAMQEHQVTVAGTTRKLSEIFLVMATQNPIEQEGTYPLPEAQLDRFVMKVELDYPNADEELEILKRDTARLRQSFDSSHTSSLTRPPRPPLPGGAGGMNNNIGELIEGPGESTSSGPTPTGTPSAVAAEEILAARHAVNHIYIDPMLERYLVTLVSATREPKRWDDELANWLARGVSPRATLALARCARARAYLAARDFVEPADILDIAADVLNHRIGMSFTARAEGIKPAQTIARILERVPIP